MKNQNGLSTIWVIVIIIVCFILGIVGGYYLKNQDEKTAITPTSTSIKSTLSASTSTPSTTSDENSDWETYTNNVFGYSLKYPQDYKLSDQCYDSKTGKKIDYDYELMPKWLVIIDKNMDDKFPRCESDFNAMDLIVRGNKSEININEMMESSDTDIESEVTINGINWAKQIMTKPSDFDGSYTTEFYANHNGRGYTISTKNTDAAGNHDATVDKIMETFQFIP